MHIYAQNVNLILNLSFVPASCMYPIFCSHVGVVAFVGNVHYAQGEFVGVIMDEPVGKNNGKEIYHVCNWCYDI